MAMPARGRAGESLHLVAVVVGDEDGGDSAYADLGEVVQHGAAAEVDEHRPIGRTDHVDLAGIGKAEQIRADLVHQVSTGVLRVRRRSPTIACVIDSGVRHLPFPVDVGSDIEVSGTDVDANRWLTEWVVGSGWITALPERDRTQLRAAVTAALDEDARCTQQLSRSFDLAAMVLVPVGVVAAAAYAQGRLDLAVWDVGASWRTATGPVLVLLALACLVMAVAILVRPPFLDHGSEWADSLDIHETPSTLRRVVSWVIRCLAAFALTGLLVLVADQVLPRGIPYVLLSALLAVVAAAVGAVAMVLLVVAYVLVLEALHRGLDPRVQLVVDLTWLLAIAAADGDRPDRPDLRDSLHVHLGLRAYWQSDRGARRRYAVMFGTAATRVERGFPRLLPRSQAVARRELRATADRIAATLRQHGRQVALGGLETDQKLPEALADGLTSACWGRWDALAVAPAPTPAKQLLRRLVPRTLGAAALVLLAFALPSLAPTWASSIPELQIGLVLLAGLVLTGTPQVAAERALGFFGRRFAHS